MARFRDLTGGGRALVGEVRASMDAVHTLEELLRWQTGGGERPRLVEVVTQDEFTHDMVFALGDVWLVYDVT